MKKLEIGAVISNAWDLAVKHWPIFVLIAFVQSCFSGIGLNVDADAYMQGISNNDPELIASAVKVSPLLAIGVLTSLYLSFIAYRLIYKTMIDGKPYEEFGEIFKVNINQVAVFFLVVIVLGLAVALGSMLCIIPGIFLAVRLMFVELIAANENLSFTDIFRRSWDLSKGHFWELFVLGLAELGIAILGLCACCVGIIFAQVIIYFMEAVAYFELKGNEPAPEAVVGESTDYVEVQ